MNINNIKLMSIVSSVLSDTSGFDFTTTTDDDITDNGIAIINVAGVIGKRLSDDDKANGQVDVDDIAYYIESCVEDSGVSAILLVFNSPGGEVTGVPELAELISEASEVKPIYAFTDTICASAAYWLASCTNGVFATPSSNVGSIGVFAIFENHTGELEQAGIKVEIFKAGKFKLLGNPFEDMTNEEKAIVQSEIDTTYEQFTTTVNDNRGGVDNEVMQGLLYNGNEALENNLVDEIVDSIDDAIEIISKPFTTDTTNNN